MPTILSHAAVPIALGLGLGARTIPRRLLITGIVASMLPDLDVLAFRFNVAYADSFGHRGASHSLAFALLLALVAMVGARSLKSDARTAFLFVSICAASHGLLDMLTNGGLGVALWWPVSPDRLFAPWQMIEVSPLALRRLFSGRGLEVLRSEFLWVWLPALLLFIFLRQSRNGHFFEEYRRASKWNR
jgi:inner membrane protein